VIGSGTAADGCTPVMLNPASWQPLFAAYKPGSDPFFHIHSNEEGFFFNIELYTVYGPGWTGQGYGLHGERHLRLHRSRRKRLSGGCGPDRDRILIQTDGTLDYPVKPGCAMSFMPVPAQCTRMLQPGRAEIEIE
jgi:hypothetical protein